MIIAEIGKNHLGKLEFAREYVQSLLLTAIDGISLTVNDVLNKSFKVAIIPHTWENTSLKFNKVGDLVNTEIDMLARYVFKALKK